MIKIKSEIINRTIKVVTDEYKEKSCELVEKVFTDYKDEKEGKTVRALVEEIRSKEYYIPELDLMAVDDNEEIIGYALFSRFQLEGRYKDELLILTPVAVRTDLQRQHISKDIIEYGFKKSKEMGFTAVLVEGNPANYNSRGFVTSSDYGIVPGKNMHLPKIECLMIKELVPGSLAKIHGKVDYGMYKTLSEDNDITLRDEAELENPICENNIEINKIENNKLDYIDLLLLADPEKEVIMQYIEKGDMFVLVNNGKALAEIIITPVDSETCELKNIATESNARGNGFAGMLIQYVFNEYKGKYKRMIVGTSENMIPFYVLNGFTKYYKTVKNFFVDNYKEEIWDGNLHCIDMYYYAKEL